MLQVQFIYDAKNMHPDFQEKINTQYLNELQAYINRRREDVIIPREGESISFNNNFTDSQGNEKSIVNTFRITKVIHNITTKTLIFSIIKL